MKRKFILFLAAVCLLSLFGITPALAAPADATVKTVKVTKSGGDLRALAVEYAKSLSEVVWQCEKSVDFTKAVSWSPQLSYLKGTQYHGLPYTSDKTSCNASLDEFLAQCDESGVYVGPTSWNDMPGSDCGGQVRMAYGWAGALNQYELENLVFNPSEECWASGMIPLGGYDCSQFTYSKSTCRSVMDVNGEEIMFDCYSQLRTGDNLFVLFGDGGEHIVLVTGDPVLVRDDSGNYIAEECSVPILELTSSVFDRGTYKSNWNTQPFTFRYLFDTGFIPYTMKAFKKETVDDVTFTNENIHIAGDVGFHDLMSGRVVSNYNIFKLTATITDGSGKQVLEGISYPLSLNADLAELNYGAGLLELPAGDYHYALTAQTGLGEMAVVDTDIHYTGCDGKPVVYIRDDGAGNGSSPDSPLGNASGYDDVTMVSYKNSVFVRAMEMLSETGGTVVVCGDVTLTSGRGLIRYTSLLSPLATPMVVSNQSVTLTSVYDGVDYREKNGAELIMQRSTDQAVDLEINIGTTWTDLDFRVDYNYTVLPSVTMSTIGAFVSFGGQKTVIEPSVNVTLSMAGAPLNAAENSEYFPNIYGSYYNMFSEGYTDVTVLGGNWNLVVGGSHSGYLMGGTNVTVGGNATLYKGLVGGNDGGSGSVCGDVTVKVTGGTIAGKLVAGSASGFDTDEYNVLLQVEGEPDLSGIRIINAGADGFAKSVVMDLSKLRLRNSKDFTAYYNAEDFTLVQMPSGSNPIIRILIAAVAAAVAVTAAVVTVVRIKRKRAA